MLRRNSASISQPGLPSASVSQQPGSPAVLPVNPNDAGQPELALQDNFENDFEAVFPPIVNAQPNANPDAIIDVQHNADFDNMLRMIEIEEKLTKELQRLNRRDDFGGSCYSVMAVVLTMAGMAYTLIAQESFEDINVGIFFTFALTLTCLASGLAIKKPLNGYKAVKNILDETDLTALENFLPPNINVENARLRQTLKTLNYKRKTLSLDLHGRLETLYSQTLIEKLQKTLNVGTTKTILPLAATSLLLMAVIWTFEQKGQSTAVATVAFLSTAWFNTVLSVLFDENISPKKARYYLNQAECRLAEVIADNNNLKNTDSITAKFAIERGLARPLSAAIRAQLTVFHDLQNVRPAVQAVRGQQQRFEMQLRIKKSYTRISGLL
ncbi:MAG: hypothetical protein V4501_07510 [Pseudomonadota bacterium]